MKRIGIISDTHSCWDERFERHFSSCDEIWHAGDLGDITVLERMQALSPIVRAVSGNVDHGQVCRSCKELEVFDCEGVNVLLTHIGGYPGRYSPGIKNLLRANGIKLFVSGHSHILRVMPDSELQLLHVNPGAAGYQGWHKVRTLIRLTLDCGEIKDLEVIELGRGLSE